MSKRIFYPLILLVIPLIGMLLTNEIKWSVFDFIIMGVLLLFLAIAIKLIRSKIANPRNKTLYIGLVILIFVAIWVEVAAGFLKSLFA